MNVSELIRTKKQLDRQLASVKKDLTDQLGDSDHLEVDGVRVERLYEQPTYKGMTLEEVQGLYEDLKAQGVDPSSVVSFNLSVKNISQVDRQVEKALWDRATGSSRGVAFKVLPPQVD